MLLVLDNVYFTSKNISDMKKDIFTERNVIIFLKAHQLMGLEQLEYIPTLPFFPQKARLTQNHKPIFELPIF